MDLEFWQNGLNMIVGGQKIKDYEVQEISYIILEGQLANEQLQKKKITIENYFSFFEDCKAGGFGFMLAKVPNKSLPHSAYQTIAGKNLKEVLNSVKDKFHLPKEILEAIEEIVLLKSQGLCYNKQSKKNIL